MFGFDCGIGPKSEATEPDYILERYKYGWLIRHAPHRYGVPMDALSECLPLMPRDAVMDAGISSASRAVFAFGTPDNCKKWRAAIEAELEASTLHPELKWLRGTDTGLSSKCIFATLAEPVNQYEAGELKKVAHLPSDSDDFGRCYRLVVRFNWRERLTELVVARPGWGPIVNKWDELTALLVANKHKELYDLIQLCKQPITSTK